MTDVVLLVGLPGAGKSTFFRERFGETHAHVSKDLLRKGSDRDRRQQELMRAALAAGRSVVVDNTNASVAERAGPIAEARRAGARVVGYFFDCETRDCVARNDERTGPARVPPVAIFATAKRLTRPTAAEGFDALFVVRVDPGPARFEVTPADTSS